MSTGSCKGCGAVIEVGEHRGHRREWCSERCRKNTTYGGSCLDCGKSLSGGNGLDREPERCGPCAHAHSIIWTREVIIDRIREWVAEYGEPPTAEDWSPQMVRSLRRPEVQRRFDAGDWPYVSSVQDRFGSWNAAIWAAGFEPRPVSQRGPDKTPRRRAAA